MLQAVMTAPGKIEFVQKEICEPGSGQVLIKIMRIGVCGSDIHVYHGKHPFTPYPVVQGHEVSGEVVRTGEGVTEFRTGDKVTIQPQVTCGRCYPCRQGSYHICDGLKVMGFQTEGAASEFFTADGGRVLKLPDGISFDEGAMVEPVAVAVHALGRGGDVSGKKVLVLGGGPIGNLVAQAAKAKGAGAVIITDLSEYRLEIAAKCGIDYCLNSAKADIERAIKEKFGPDKADLILECVGVNATIDQAVSFARKGSDIIAVGVFSEKAGIDMGLVQDRELRIIGTLMYQRCDYLKAMELIKNGGIRLKPLITNHFAFKDYLKAYKFIQQQKSNVMKVMIDVNDQQS
ncbi:MAG: zinc-binding dehydrogenase [Ruminiclostridium sp.]|nr:zinc-binding dehydrogenase [Ruminiclostridium sp.]